MRPHCVVVIPPPIDQDLGFTQRIEDLAIKQLVSEFTVEALDESILPRVPRLDIQRGHTHMAQPVSDRLGRKLSTVVRSDVLGYSTRGQNRSSTHGLYAQPGAARNCHR